MLYRNILPCGDWCYHSILTSDKLCFFKVCLILKWFIPWMMNGWHAHIRNIQQQQIKTSWCNFANTCHCIDCWYCRTLVKLWINSSLTRCENTRQIHACTETFVAQLNLRLVHRSQGHVRLGPPWLISLLCQQLLVEQLPTYFSSLFERLACYACLA